MRNRVLGTKSLINMKSGYEAETAGLNMQAIAMDLRGR